MNPIKQAASRIPPQLLLLLVAIIGYWQIAFLHNSLQWDMMDVVLPWRYYVSEALQNNYLPLWNPYQQMGYPIHADMQYPFWYIEQLIIGYTVGYNNYTMNFLFVFYIWIGGCGMYRLCSFLKVDKSAAFYAAVVYMLAGFMVGHIQLFTQIVGTVWVPHVVVSYLKLIKSNSFRHLPATALFMFLLITGGYQAFTFMTCYLLFALFVNESVIRLKQKQKSEFLQLIKVNSTLLVTVVALSSFIIVLLYQLIPYANRMDGGTLEFVNFLPLSPQCLISLLLPFAVVKETDFFATDISMANAYMGMTVLVFVFVSLFRKKTSEEKLFLVFGTIALIASFGKYTPVREILFRYFPFFNLFRFPGIISYFTLLTFIPVAAKQFQLVIQNEASKRIIRIGFAGIVLCLLFLLVYSYSKVSFSDFGFKGIFHDLYQALGVSTIYEHIFVQSLIQLCLISLITYALLKGRKFFFVSCVVIEMLLTVQFNIHYTGVSAIKPTDLKQTLNKLPVGFPLPGMRSVDRNSDLAASEYGLERNTNIFKKQISFDGFGSFWLKQYNELFLNNPRLKDSIIKNPFVYLSDNIAPLKNYITGVHAPVKDIVFVDDSIYKNYKNVRFAHHQGDSIIPVSVVPNEFVFNAITRDSTIFNLLQSNYTGWKVLIDGKRVTHFTANMLCMATVLPPGQHEVRFVYSNRPFVNAMIFSYLLAVVLLILLIVRYYKSNRALGKYLLVSLIVVTAAMSFLLIVRHRTDDQNKKNEMLEKTLDELNKIGVSKNDFTVVMCVDNPFATSVSKWLTEAHFPKVVFNDLWDNKDKAQLLDIVEHSITQNFILAWSGTYISDDIKYLIQQKYPRCSLHQIDINSGYMVLSKQKSDDIVFESRNDFEKEYKYWRFVPEMVDTLVFVSGEKSCLLDSIQEYSPSFSSSFKELANVDKAYLYVDLEFRTVDSANSVLVIAISNKEKTKQWISVRMRDFSINERGWNKMAYCQKLRLINPEDIISIYVWSPEKQHMNIDDMRVFLYKANE